MEPLTFLHAFPTHKGAMAILTILQKHWSAPKNQGIFVIERADKRLYNVCFDEGRFAKNHGDPSISLDGQIQFLCGFIRGYLKGKREAALAHARTTLENLPPIKPRN